MAELKNDPRKRFPFLSELSRKVNYENTNKTRVEINTGGGGCFLVDEVGLWGCAAKWGRIFTTGLMGLHRVSRMGSHICGILGVGKFR